MSDRYLDRVLEGSALWTDIDDYVDEWHEGGGFGAELHEYLGLTWPEYSYWVEEPTALQLVIAARRQERPLEDVVAGANVRAFAARGLSTEDAATVVRWLEQTGRLPRE